MSKGWPIKKCRSTQILVRRLSLVWERKAWADRPVTLFFFYLCGRDLQKNRYNYTSWQSHLPSLVVPTCSICRLRANQVRPIPTFLSVLRCFLLGGGGGSGKVSTITLLHVQYLRTSRAMLAALYNWHTGRWREEVHRLSLKDRSIIDMMQMIRYGVSQDMYVLRTNINMMRSIVAPPSLFSESVNQHLGNTSSILMKSKWNFFSSFPLFFSSLLFFPFSFHPMPWSIHSVGTSSPFVSFRWIQLIHTHTSNWSIGRGHTRRRVSGEATIDSRNLVTMTIRTACQLHIPSSRNPILSLVHISICPGSDH